MGKIMGNEEDTEIGRVEIHLRNNDSRLDTIEKDYYGNGKLGDRTRVLIMWRGIGAAVFLAGYGAHGFIDQIISTMFKK